MGQSRLPMTDTESSASGGFVLPSSSTDPGENEIRCLNFVEKLSQAQEPEVLNEKLLEGLTEMFGLSSASLGVLQSKNSSAIVQQFLEIKSSDANGLLWNHNPLTIELDKETSKKLMKGGQLSIADNGASKLLLPVGEHDKQLQLLCLGGCQNPDSGLDGLAKIIRIYFNFYRNLDQGQRDKLTGLLNRQTFDSKLSRMLERQKRLAQSYASASEERRRAAEQRLPWLAIIDIDHFKRVNDRFGHVFGDEVILSIGQHIRACFRKSDLLFRFGGEEFVVVLEPIPADSVMIALERLRSLVARQELQNVGKVTVTIGYAAFTENAFPPKIIDCADQALYYAKAHGRNQIANYEQLIAEGKLEETQQGDGGIDLF